MIAHSTDHVTRGLALALAQFRGKPKIEGVVSPWLVQIQEVEDMFLDLLILRWLPNATGAQLDILGRIVGQPRGARTDALYRLWIAARAMANRSSGLPEQLYAILRKLVGPDVDVFLSEEPPAGFTLVVDEPIDENEGNEIAKIVQIAKAAGVRGLFQWFRPGAPVFRFGGNVDDETPVDTGFGAAFAAASDGVDVTWEEV